MTTGSQELTKRSKALEKTKNGATGRSFPGYGGRAATRHLFRVTHIVGDKIGQKQVTLVA